MIVLIPNWVPGDHRDGTEREAWPCLPVRLTAPVILVWIIALRRLMCFDCYPSNIIELANNRDMAMVCLFVMCVNGEWRSLWCGVDRQTDTRRQSGREGEPRRRTVWIILNSRRIKKLSLSAINYGLCASAGICDSSGRYLSSADNVSPHKIQDQGT